MPGMNRKKIGAPIERPAVGFIGDDISGGIVVNGEGVGLDDIPTKDGVAAVEAINCLIDAGPPNYLKEHSGGIPTEHPKVAGRCPMGCGETLFLGDGGHVTCSLVGCPDPEVVDKLLHECTDHRHVVQFDEKTFTLQHPLHERVRGHLLDCTLHGRIADDGDEDAPPMPPGRYYVEDRDGHLRYEPLGQEGT